MKADNYATNNSRLQMTETNQDADSSQIKLTTGVIPDGEDDIDMNSLD